MPFDFLHGEDEYLTEQRARERWAQLREGLDPEFGSETVDGRCSKVEEVEAMVNAARQAAQSMGLFGGGRAVWIKGVNFIADTPTGRAEGTLAALEELKPILENADGTEVRLLISASPVDKRLSFFKYLTAKGKAEEVQSLDAADPQSLARFAKEKGLTFAGESAEIFLKKVGTSARALESELEKLATYLDARPATPRQVDEALVMELTSTVAEGEFFEPVEAFYARKVGWALKALRDYYALRKDADARPILATFFNRNRLLLLMKAAEAEGYARLGARGISWTAKGEAMKAQLGGDKTPFNLFAQHPFYLGKLAGEAQRFTLDELHSLQRELVDAFEKIHEQDQQTVLEGLVIKSSSR